MKEAEFTKTSNGSHWMDTSIISDHPLKLTIIDPTQYVEGILNVFNQLPCIVEAEYTKPALKHLARAIVLTIMQGVVNRARAWIYGDDVEYHIHLINMRELIGFDVEANLREELRYDLNDPINEHASKMLDGLLKEMLELMNKHMNPNRFVIHRVTQGRDLRTLMIEEYCDWRVLQWTRSEQEKIDNRHENI